MHNKVVEVLARGLSSLGLGTLRFNFRGVGASAGSFDGGRGEQDDLRAAVAWTQQQPGARRLVVVGYSFGAWMASATFAGSGGAPPLVLVAPPLVLHPHAELQAHRGYVQIAAGSDDSFCPTGALRRLVDALPRATLHLLPGVDHFFHGALGQLWAALEPGLRSSLAPDPELAADAERVY